MGRHIHLKRFVLSLTLVVLALGGLALADRIATDRAVAGERGRLIAIAGLAASNYIRQVDMFELVATTLSDDPEVRQAVDGGDPIEAERLNDRLATLTAKLDASVIYLMNGQGTTVASSNWRQPDSFLGENYRFRAYFNRALAEGESSQFALGTRSQVPGLFLARRIAGIGGEAGVLVVKIRFDRLEREWAKSIGQAFVSDPQGIILITSDPLMRFKTLGFVPLELRPTLRAAQEFGKAPLDQHPAFAAKTVLTHDRWGGETLLAVNVSVDGHRTLTVLSPITAAVRSARNVARLTTALLVVGILASVLVVNARRRVLVTRAERLQQGRIEDLKTRLEQANRLSFLGQIAAGVGHELNQPLAAIGMRANSAGKLLTAGSSSEAASALGEIEALVARAGAITGELKRFARRADRSVGSVPLRAALDGLSLLMNDRLRHMNARMAVTLHDESLCVIADQGRLEQVLVNLVQNALDAGGDGTLITIAVEPCGDTVVLTVIDDGPGVPAELKSGLFQPFTSSKSDGLGLGLVISRDIVAEFGGFIKQVEKDSGAAFQVSLRRGKP